jgi:hypothetical protein
MPANFPTTPPKENLIEVAMLQFTLMTDAETLFGERDASLEIAQPRFGDSGPVVLLSPDNKAIFAQLSPSAAVDWSSAVYELSHASIRMLDPKEGDGLTTWLEEGVAAAFAGLMVELKCQEKFRPSREPYLSALTLIESLPIPPMVFGLQARQRFGAFYGFGAAQLAEAFPQLSTETAEKLAAMCVTD